MMGVRVLVCVFMMMLVLMKVFRRMNMLVFVPMPVLVSVLILLLLQRQFLPAIDEHVDLGRGDSVAVDDTNIQRGSDVQGANRFQQQLRRNSG
jgi:hypothetical protein